MEAGLHKNRIKESVFFALIFIFLLILTVADFTVIPNIYGENVSFIKWIFTDPKKIISILGQSGTVLNETDSVIGKLFPLFMWIWLIGFFFTLFYLGKHFHTKSEECNQNATMLKKEPYLMIQNINSSLKQIKRRKSSKELERLMCSAKFLEERLSTESDFGYGNELIINCENNIAQQLELLLDYALNIEAGDFEENINSMNMTMINISSLIERRVELKRR